VLKTRVKLPQKAKLSLENTTSGFFRVNSGGSVNLEAIAKRGFAGKP